MKGLSSHRAKTNIGIVVLVAVLLELVSAAQYYSARSLLETKLESHALSELTIKALRVKSILRQAEGTVAHHKWYAERHLSEPDTMFVVTRRMTEYNSRALGAFVAFRPGYYDSRGHHFFEPCARHEGDSIVLEQMADNGNDYTHKAYYEVGIRGDTVAWTEPYPDVHQEKVGNVSTYALPLRDSQKGVVGIIAIDLELGWMGQTINDEHIYPSSYNLVLSASGQLLAAPNSSKVSKKRVEQVVSLVNDSTVERHLTANRRSTVIDFKDIESGEKAYIYYATMRGKPRWQQVLVCYDHEVYGQLHKVSLRLLLLMAVGMLLLAFIVWRTARNEQRLQQERQQRERLDGELAVARHIQHEMVPKTFPPFPSRADIDVYASLLPAREVGGDLFDFFIRDEKLFFCIGDVSGKGVPAAMIMSMVLTQFRMITAHESSPTRVMQTINEASCEGNDSNMFVTLFIGVLDLPTGRLRYCNAGHDHPMVTGQGTNELDTLANMPVGLFSDFKYEQQETTLLPGTTLLLFTDGISEAMNASRQQYGTKRLLALLRQTTERRPQQLIETVVGAVKAFVEDAPQSDDLTLLALSYTPQQEHDTFCQTLTLNNDVREVARLSTFLKGIAATAGLKSDVAKSLRLATEEAVVNAMEYAYPAGTHGTVTVTAKGNDSVLRLIIEDNGSHFDPTAKFMADTTLNADERPIGGLGILLMRELMDTMNYERRDGKNILSLSKNIRGETNSQKDNQQADEHI